MMSDDTTSNSQKEAKMVQKTPETALGILDLPVLNLEDDNSFNVLGETNNGTKQKNILAIVKNDYLIVGQIINHISSNLYGQDDRFINLDMAGGMVLTIDRYPILHELLQGSVLLDSSYSDPNGLTFKINDMTAYPYLRAGGDGVQEQSNSKHSHNLDSNGKTVDAGELGTIFFRDYNLSSIKLWAEGDGSGDFGTRADNLTTRAITGSEEGDYPNVHNVLVLSDRQRNLTGRTTDTGTGIATNNEIKAIKTYRYIIGDSKS